jgi:hypothetical protein
MTDVFDAARREIIEQHDVIAAIEQPFRQMRTDKAGTACDQIAQEASLTEIFIFISKYIRRRR